MSITATKPAPTQLALLSASAGMAIPWTSMAQHAQVSTCQVLSVRECAFLKATLSIC